MQLICITSIGDEAVILHQGDTIFSSDMMHRVMLGAIYCSDCIIKLLRLVDYTTKYVATKQGS